MQVISYEYAALDLAMSITVADRNTAAKFESRSLQLASFF